MAEERQNGSTGTVLLAATRSTAVASRMAMRFAQAGCGVAAIYPSKAHPLAVTKAVGSHYHYSLIDPVASLSRAMIESGAGLVVPCDGIAVRNLHTLFGSLASTPEGAAIGVVIKRSLGDSTAYLVIDSRHEIQIAARSEGLHAAESFAIGRATDPDTLAQNLKFPWVMKADYSWGGRGTGVVSSLAEAREFAHGMGAPPSLAMALKQLWVNGDRAALGEWMHAKRTGLSAQRPIAGTMASAAVACWQGEVLATVSVEVASCREPGGPPAVVRIVENEEMLETVTRMSERLGLSGFGSFDFVLEEETGGAFLTEFSPHCTGPSHLNAGDGHDLVDAMCRKWLGNAMGRPPAHAGKVVAYFPNAWAANPADPLLETNAYDVPSDDPAVVRRLLQLVARDQRYLALKARIGRVSGNKAST